MFSEILLYALSLVLTLLFFVYGFNHYYLLKAARKYRIPARPARPLAAPTVAVHLPVYNERYVVRRLIRACAQMAEAYAIDRVRLLVLDDSDDDTSAEVDAVVAEYRQKGFHIEAVRRAGREGFKAGALQAALLRTHEDFIAVFDADFIPARDFLVRSVPYLAADPHLGIVQGRWSHLNRNYNALTRAIAVGIDVHFLIEQAGRYAAGCFQNFNGSGGLLRRSAITAAGGWHADTLAEDLDVSYRIQSAGYRILYLSDLQSPAEIPPTVPSFKRQQGRWACGSLRTAKKLLPGLMRRRDLDWRRRLQAALHLTSYMLHPLMLFAFILMCLLTLRGMNTLTLPSLAALAGGRLDWEAVRSAILLAARFTPWALLILLIALCGIAPWIAAVTALRGQGLPVVRNLPSLVVLFLLGYGTSMSNTIEAAKALLTNRNWAFARTPKYATVRRDGRWKDKRYQVPLDFSSVLELLLVILGAVTMGFAIGHANFGILLFLAPYTAAFAFVFSLTLMQSRNVAVR